MWMRISEKELCCEKASLFFYSVLWLWSTRLYNRHNKFTTLLCVFFFQILYSTICFVFFLLRILYFINKFAFGNFPIREREKRKLLKFKWPEICSFLSLHLIFRKVLIFCPLAKLKISGAKFFSAFNFFFVEKTTVIFCCCVFTLRHTRTEFALINHWDLIRNQPRNQPPVSFRPEYDQQNPCSERTEKSAFACDPHVRPT